MLRLNVALQGMQRILSSTMVLQVEFIPHHLGDDAGVSVAEFLEPLQEHFTALFLPHQGRVIDRDAFEPVLSAMAEQDEVCEALLFLKAEAQQLLFP